MFSSLTSWVPVAVLAKIYLKVLFLHLNASCSSLTIWSSHNDAVIALSATYISALVHLQNHALRVATSQLVSTHLEPLHLETEVQRYNTCSNRLILRAQEKALQSSDDHPKHLALTANIPQRLLNRSRFCRKANGLPTLFSAELEHRQLINQFSSPPWQFGTPS